MFKRVVIAYGCLFILGGCIYNDEPMPKITDDYSSSQAAQQKLLAPTKSQLVLSDENIPRAWLPSLQAEKKWTAIVIHHSGTKNGNAAIFDRWHREGNHWEGVGYDFVIGNGTNSGDGEVEVTYRWRRQVTGAHCGGTIDNWANEDGVGICLVGNFNQTKPTNAQMQSLIKLIRFLQNRYGIPKSRIYGHRDTPGAGTVTDCPGKKFPMGWLKLQLLP
jgi:hypothetical protein